LALLAAAGVQRQLAPDLAWGTPLDHEAVLCLVAVLVAAGCLYLTLPWLIARDQPQTRRFLGAAILAGLAMRLLLFGTEPALEDDAYRYLWDGASVVEGFNPYRNTPQQAVLNPEVASHALAMENSRVVERVNHPWLRTPYPPLAQAGFALAVLIAPFDLDAWRAVLLAAEGLTLALLLVLLKMLGRAPVWALLYWWNPLIVREFAGAAHMDALLLPFLVAATCLLVQARWRGAGFALVLAAGVKLWPLVLLPFALLRLRARPMQVSLTLLGAAMLLLLLFLPMLETVLTPSSGLNAFAESWHMNAAVFGVLAKASWHLGLPEIWPRMAVAVAVVLLALVLAWRAPERPEGWVCRMIAVAAALFLLGPVGFPWYASWFLVLLAVRPVAPLHWLTALLPLYELRFVLEDRGEAALFHTWIVWAQFAPVWFGLLWIAWRRRGTLCP
jgi:alpha-1,6-mannosyltransferase